jgi:PAS domain S-box-containing protein
MKEKQISSSIDLTWELPLGTQFCLFYLTKEDLMSIIVPYLKAGLENSEFCIWVLPEAFDLEEAKKVLKKNIPDFNSYLEKEQIEIIPFTSSGIKSGISNSKKMVTTWNEKLGQALDNGYSGLRLVQEVSWLKEKEGENFTDYEKEMDELIRSSQIISLCTYSSDKYSSVEIFDIIGAYEFSLFKKKGNWKRIGSSSREAPETNFNITGYEPEEAQSKTYNNLNYWLQEPPIDKIRSNIQRTINIEKCKNAEAALKCTLSSLNLFIAEVEKCKIAEAALQESKERLLIAKEAADLGIHDYNPVTGVIQWDSRVRELWGIEPDETITYDFFIAGIHPDDRAATQEMVNRALDPTGDGKYCAEYRVINRKNGVERWVAANGKVFFEYGHAIRLVGTVQDITERKKAEEALRKSEELFRTVIENSRDGINLLDLATGRYVFMSPAQVEMTGFTTEEINNISAEEAYERVYPEDREISAFQQKKVASGIDTTSTVEYRWKVKSGEYRWFSDSRKLVRDASGHPVALVGVSRDITERKNAEEMLKVSEERLRLAAQAAGFGIYDGDLIAGATYWSPEMKQILGLPVDAPAPPPGVIPSFIHPEDIEHVQQMFQQAFDPAGNDVVFHEHRIIRPDGSVRWVQFNGNVVFSGEGSKRHAVRSRGMMLDITEHKQKEQKILRYNRVLDGISRIFESVVKAETEEELGNLCLSVALELTGGGIGFVGEIGTDGLLHDIAISEMGNQCLMYDKSEHRLPPGDFVLHGLYGRVIDSGKSFFTNDPQSHPDSIGLPKNHPSLRSFLGTPLILNEKQWV